MLVGHANDIVKIYEQKNCNAESRNASLIREGFNLIFVFVIHKITTVILYKY